MQKYLYVGIGIFLVIAYATTRQFVGHDHVILEEDTEAVMVRTISNRMKGKVFIYYSPLLL